MYFLTPTSDEYNKQTREDLPESKTEAARACSILKTRSPQFLPGEGTLRITHTVSSECGCLLTLSPLSVGQVGSSSDHKEPRLHSWRGHGCSDWRDSDLFFIDKGWVCPVPGEWHMQVGGQWPEGWAVAHIVSDPRKSPRMFPVGPSFALGFNQWQIFSKRMWVQVICATLDPGQDHGHASCTMSLPSSRSRLDIAVTGLLLSSRRQGHLRS